MKKNIGTFDRVVRLILGVFLLLAVLFVNNLLVQIFLGLLGLFSIYEALVGWCAFYALIGKRTCPIE